MLAPAETLDGYGLLTTPPESATGLAANAFARRRCRRGIRLGCMARRMGVRR